MSTAVNKKVGRTVHAQAGMLSDDRGKSVRERGKKGSRRRKQELKEGPILLSCWSCAGKTPVVWKFSSALYSGCFAFHMLSATNNLSPVHPSVHPFAHEVSIVSTFLHYSKKREGGGSLPIWWCTEWVYVPWTLKTRLTHRPPKRKKEMRGNRNSTFKCPPSIPFPFK